MDSEDFKFSQHFDLIFHLAREPGEIVDYHKLDFSTSSLAEREHLQELGPVSAPGRFSAVPKYFEYRPALPIAELSAA